MLPMEDFVDSFEDNFDDFDSKDFETQDEGKFSGFLEEIKPIIKKAMSNYFYDKELHNGDPIDVSLFELSHYTNLVMNTNIIDGVNNAYKIIEDNQFINTDESFGSIEKDVVYMIDLIKNIQRRVPQDFVGGMILMHLELVEGLEVW